MMPTKDFKNLLQPYLKTTITIDTAIPNSNGAPAEYEGQLIDIGDDHIVILDSAGKQIAIFMQLILAIHLP